MVSGISVMSLGGAGLSDLGEIMRLERAGFPAGIVEGEAVFQHRLEVFPEGFFLLRREGSDAPIGYACCEIWKDRGDYEAPRFELGHDLGRWHDPAGEECYLASMTVDPAARKSGAGRYLFRETLSAMRGRFPALRRAVLLVNEAWPVAWRIYREEGFVVACRLPGFFRPENGAPQAGLVMEKEF